MSIEFIDRSAQYWVCYDETLLILRSRFEIDSEGEMLVHECLSTSKSNHMKVVYVNELFFSRHGASDPVRLL